MNKRVFIAIDISERARRTAEARISALRNDLPRYAITWMRPEKLHLTLRFIGDVDELQLDSIAEAIENTAKRFSRFRLVLEGTGVFPTAEKPRILWIGVDDQNSNCTNIKSELEMKLSEFAFAGERNIFTPHLTIARIKEPRLCPDLVEQHLKTNFEHIEFEVNELMLYESKLFPAGSVYSKHASFKLKN